MNKAGYYANHWSHLVIDRLLGLAIDHFFIAPGSRSTPIAAAIARHGSCRKFWGIDERSVAFMALGYGRRAGLPGVVLVTSGTAVANLYPAVMEAFLSDVPLLLLTADRPYYLRDAGANQTVFQAGMFEAHINRSFDLAPPSPELD